MLNTYFTPFMITPLFSGQYGIRSCTLIGCFCTFVTLHRKGMLCMCVSVCLYRRFFAGLCWWNSETILTAIWSVWKWFQFWHGWELGHRSKRHSPLVFSCKRDTHCEIYCGKMTWTNVCYLSNIVKCLEKVKVIWQLFLIIVIIYKIQIWFIKNFSHIGPNLFKSVSKIQAKGKVTLGIEREEREREREGRERGGESELFN